MKRTRHAEGSTGDATSAHRSDDAGDARNDGANLADLLTSMRDEIARLSDRVASLEAATRAQAAAAPRSAAPVEEPISDTVLAVISAAVAAYLGKKPRIRSVRILSSPEWARQGRAHIQASHVLGRR